MKRFMTKVHWSALEKEPEWKEHAAETNQIQEDLAGILHIP